jgi:hypothetical protein
MGFDSDGKQQKVFSLLWQKVWGLGFSEQWNGHQFHLMKLSLPALNSEVPATYVLSGLKPLEARVGEGEIHPPLYTRIPKLNTKSSGEISC